VTIDELFQAATQAHARGDHAAAERQYREVLAREPGHAATLANLGVLLAGPDRRIVQVITERPLKDSGMRSRNA
jgi:hypothetical protein